MNEYDTYLANMQKLAKAIERKAIKAFSKYPESNHMTLTVLFAKGWFGGETQEEATMSMCLTNKNGTKTLLRISPYVGEYGNIRIDNEFALNYNKMKNVRADVIKLIDLNEQNAKDQLELENRRKRNEGSKGFKNPLLSW